MTSTIQIYQPMFGNLGNGGLLLARMIKLGSNLDCLSSGYIKITDDAMKFLEAALSPILKLPIWEWYVEKLTLLSSFSWNALNSGTCNNSI